MVGDEDQAIYRFRGASVENILRFPQVFEEDCETVYLEKIIVLRKRLYICAING
ncbi:hypothetical protein HMPREF9466_01776 [Fusobacterium necrophorum subsp. funduliforme 1_1_36S]|nr:hypothetical protein HMPREF9466_01776 [Fusobacterium necrophorum subsp. funduliforme 1_1_36S]